MANLSQNHPPGFLGGVVEVTVGGVVDVSSPLVGRSIIDGLRTKLSAGSQVQQGDYFMDRSRDLLRRHLQLIEVHQQDTIRLRIDDVRDIKNNLENFCGSRFQRLLEARKYRRLSKVTYKIVKNASDKAIDNILMNQIVDATRAPGGGSGSGQASVPRNPFTDSHAISTLTGVSVNTLDRMEMSTYRAETTDEAAVVLDFVAQDQSVHHIVATFPTNAFSGDITDMEVPAGISLHREDGTMPRFIAASPPDVSDQRANEESENIKLLSNQRIQRSGADSELNVRLAETGSLTSVSSVELMIPSLVVPSIVYCSQYCLISSRLRRDDCNLFAFHCISLNGCLTSCETLCVGSDDSRTNDIKFAIRLTTAIIL